MCPSTGLFGNGCPIVWYDDEVETPRVMMISFLACACWGCDPFSFRFLLFIVCLLFLFAATAVAPAAPATEGLPPSLTRVGQTEAYPNEFTGERIVGRKELDIHQSDVSREQLMGYIRSWSGYTKYCQDHDIAMGSDQDPVQTVLGDEKDATTAIVWPVAMLLSVKKEDSEE